MPRLVFLAIIATWLSSGAGLAQTAPLQPVPAAPNLSGGGVREARQTCRAESDAKGLAGQARRAAIRACMQARFPDSEATRRASSGLTRDGKPTARAARDACRNDVASKELKGAERKAALAACFKEKRPDLAARADCRRQARDKGLAGDALKSAVKACAKS